MFSLPERLLIQTFDHFRRCGRGARECQTLWLSRWQSPEFICLVVHPDHRSHAGGFEIDDGWLHRFWLRLGVVGMGIRVQVHTHPREAFHSETDDRFPVIHSPGFLSLVIPDFGMGPVGFASAYLCELDVMGHWQEVPAGLRLQVT